MNICPLCAETVDPRATQCPYCDTALRPARQNATLTCPTCAEDVGDSDLTCPHCDSVLDPRPEAPAATATPPVVSGKAEASAPAPQPARAPTSAFSAIAAARRAQANDLARPSVGPSAGAEAQPAPAPKPDPSSTSADADEDADEDTSSHPSRLRRVLPWVVGVVLLGAVALVSVILAIPSPPNYAPPPEPTITLEDPDLERVKALFAADSDGSNWERVRKAPDDVRDSLATVAGTDLRAVHDSASNSLDFCRKASALRPSSPTVHWATMASTCAILDEHHKNLDSSVAKNRKIIFTETEISLKLVKLNKQIENTSNQIEDTTSINLVLEAYVVSPEIIRTKINNAQIYEISNINLYKPDAFTCKTSTTCFRIDIPTAFTRGGPTGRAGLSTTTTSFTTKGNVLMYVEISGAERVPLVGGETGDWLHLSEADPTHWNELRDELVTQMSRRANLDRELLELDSPIDLGPLEARVEAARRDLERALRPPEPTAATTPPSDTTPLPAGAEQAKAKATCLDPDSLVGRWRLTGLVTEAKKPSWVGVNQFFELDIESTRTGLTGTLTMTGYTPDIWLPQGRQYVGTAPIALGCTEASLDLVLAHSRDASQRRYLFTLDNDALHGVWHDQGATWTRHGARGGFITERGDGARLRVASVDDLPCPTRCQLSNTHVEPTNAGAFALAERGDLAGCLSRCP